MLKLGIILNVLKLKNILIYQKASLNEIYGEKIYNVTAHDKTRWN